MASTKESKGNSAIYTFKINKEKSEKELINYLKKYHYFSYLSVKKKLVTLYVVGHNYYNLKLNFLGLLNIHW